MEVNKTGAKRNTWREYLLGGHLRCKQCGHAYAGGTGPSGRADGSYKRLYRCLGKWKWKDNDPTRSCHNKGWSANKLEAIVWGKLVEYLSEPEFILEEIESKRNNAGELSLRDSALKDVEQQLRAVDREQHHLLQWAMKGFPEHQVEAENRRLNQSRGTLEKRKLELGARLKASQEAVINLPKLEDFIRRFHDRMPDLDYQGKRDALEMLGITVSLDGENVEITGSLPEDVIASLPSRGRRPSSRATPCQEPTHH